MLRFTSVLLGIIGLFISVSVLFAQEDTCPALVKQALETTSTACAATGRNQACYGNITLEAEPQPDVTDFTFDFSGDIINVTDLQSLTLSRLDESAGVWGISLMKIQANLPDTLPGQNVTFLLFGDVNLQPVPPLPQQAGTIIASSNANVRSGASSTDPVVTTVVPGTSLRVNGRNASTGWLRITLEDGSTGWVSANLVTVEGDTDSLPVVESGAAAYGPMQAFYFQSGISDAPCIEAPNSGILIQTPEGAGEVVLRIDEVQVRLGSTVFLQAQAGAVLTVYVLEGQARVTAFDVERTVPAGGRVTVPIDENLAASGPPTAIEPYTETVVNALPIEILEIPVEIAAPLTAADLAAADTTETTTCTVTTSGAVNTRSGPGTVYSLSGGLNANTSSNPTGQADGSDGYTWWQFANGSWVREDVVDSAGNCAVLPVVVDIPPTPTPAPVTQSNTKSSSSDQIDNRYVIQMCAIQDPADGPLLAGQRVHLSIGVGSWPSEGEAQAALAGKSAIIMVDGVELSNYINPIHTWPPGSEHYVTSAVATWTATSGTHTFYGEWPGVSAPTSQGSCVVSIP